MLVAITWFPDSLAESSGHLLDLAIKATLILVFTVLVNAVLRRLSAAFRHACYSLGLLSLLLLPVLSLALPSWRFVLPIAFATDTVSATTALNDAATPTANIIPSSEFIGSMAAQVPISQTEAPELGLVHRPIEAEASRATLPDFSLVSISWLVGACILIVSTVFGFVRAHRFRAASTETADQNWLTEFEHVTSGRKRFRRVRLLENKDASVPMMCGVIHAVIILPAGYQAATPEDRRRILTHELAHVQRRDVAIHFVGRIACSLYWFHPLAWWCLHRMRQEREYACDDLVLASGSVASEYAEQLLFVARQQFTAKKAFPGTIGIIHHTGVEQRIKVLLSEDASHAQPRGIVLTSALAVFALFTTGIAVMNPQLSQATSSLQDGIGGSEPGEQGSTIIKDVEDKTVGVSITCLDQQGLPIADAEVYLYQGRLGEKGESKYIHCGLNKQSAAVNWVTGTNTKAVEFRFEPRLLQAPAQMQRSLHLS